MIAISIHVFTHRVVLILICHSAGFVFKINFFKNITTYTIKEANGLYPGQNRCSVGTDLGPNCLQRLTAEKS